MNTTTRSLLLSFLCLAPLATRADITVNLDAGLLTSPLTAAMQHDNSMNSPHGSLLLLIDIGNGLTLSNTLTAGHYVSGTDTILAAGGFNTNGDLVTNTNETLTTFTIASGLGHTNDEIALRWFPQITLAQYQANPGVLPVAGQSFGTYDPTSGGTQDGGDTWILPSQGSQIALDMFTSNSAGGGSQTPSAGYAGSLVQGVALVPEPSTYALFGLGAFGLFFARRRMAKVSAK